VTGTHHVTWVLLLVPACFRPSLTCVLINGPTSLQATTAHLTAGQWAHVACTYDGTAAAIYVDGVASTTATGGGTTLTTPGQGAPLPSLNLPLAQGKVIGPVRPGVFPDFVGADKPSAEAVLRDNDISYIIVESVNKNVAKGLVISQAPAAGAKASAGATITLYVSAGPG